MKMPVIPAGGTGNKLGWAHLMRNRAMLDGMALLHNRIEIIMHRKSTTVKEPARQSYTHRATQESMKAFLGRHPLPKPLKPFRAAIEKFPDFPTVARIVIDLVTAGLTDAQIGQALEQIAEQIQPGAHRCASCLAWTEAGVTGAFIHSGITHALTFCPQCTALASTGRHTEAMTRNLIAYIQSEVKP